MHRYVKVGLLPWKLFSRERKDVGRKNRFHSFLNGLTFTVLDNETSQLHVGSKGGGGVENDVTDFAFNSRMLFQRSTRNK